jgi:hypothetical protein
MLCDVQSLSFEIYPLINLMCVETSVGWFFDSGPNPN